MWYILIAGQQQRCHRVGGRLGRDEPRRCAAAGPPARGQAQRPRGAAAGEARAADQRRGARCGRRRGGVADAAPAVRAHGVQRRHHRCQVLRWQIPVDEVAREGLTLAAAAAVAMRFTAARQIASSTLVPHKHALGGGRLTSFISKLHSCRKQCACSRDVCLKAGSSPGGYRTCRLVPS